jgi:hypothetical protein
MTDYYEILIEGFFNFLLNASVLLALVMLGALVIATFSDIIAEEQSQTRAKMTTARFIAGLCLLAFSFSPLGAMSLFNDLTGFNINGSVCSVIKMDESLVYGRIDTLVDVENCLNKMEEKIQQTIKPKTEGDSAQIDYGIYIKVVQLFSLLFFLVSLFLLFKHVLGYRDSSVSVTALLLSMAVSSAVFMLPVMFDYIEDLRDSSSVVIG